MASINQSNILFEATMKLLGLQCGVVATDGIAIIGTGDYKKKVGTRRPQGCYFLRSMETREVFAIHDPQFKGNCLDCEAHGVCPYSVVLCAPITCAGEVIGVAGLLGYDGFSNDFAEKSREKLIEYINGLANSLSRHTFIAGALKIRQMDDLALRKAFNLEKRQGLVIADEDMHIIKTNTEAKKMLGYGQDEVDFNRSLSTIMSPEMLEQLVNRDFKNLDFILEQNGSVMNLSIRGTHKISLSNGIAIVMEAVSNRYRTLSAKIDPMLDRIIGEDPVISDIKSLIKQAARSDMPVLIMGESGTGKELIAEALHSLSPRCANKMVVINCAAVPDTLIESELFGYEHGAFSGATSGGKKGKFELAQNSTLFLDEIGEMSLIAQSKLLRILENKEFYKLGGLTPLRADVRIIAATNAPLAQLVAAGKFREDLFYRLNAISIRLPPLRERSGDIPLLVRHFVDAYNRRDPNTSPKSVSQPVLDALETYTWPGNIRQLKNAVEYMLLMSHSDLVGTCSLPDYLRGGGITPDHAPYLRKRTIREIEEALTIFGVSTEGKRKAANYLGISLPTLYRVLKSNPE